VRATRACPVCEDERTAARLTVAEQMFGLPETFEYLMCAGCGSLFIESVPGDLAKYYDAAAYYSFDDDPAVTMGRRGVRQVIATLGRSILLGPGPRVLGAGAAIGPRPLRTLVSILESVRRAGLPRGRDTRVLDVGAGAGTLVYALDLAGIRHVTGIDPFAGADRQIGRRSRLLRRELDDLDDEFDLVMFHHSLEHVPDPRATLELARERLSPTGRVLVRLPTVSSEAFVRYGSAWIGCDAPRHLTVPSRRGMEILSGQAGYTIRSVVDDSNESQFWASEQYRRGIPLVAASSHFVAPEGSAFSGAEIRAWHREAGRLNRQNRGDQAAWVLDPTPAPEVAHERVIR
jgi:SAM-dependent methyltransferase